MKFKKLRLFIQKYLFNIFNFYLHILFVTIHIQTMRFAYECEVYIILFVYIKIFNQEFKFEIGKKWGVIWQQQY